MASVFLFFVDGLGIGLRNSSNPLSNLAENSPLAHFQNEKSEIFEDGILVETDACLGIEGRPQSASGQTTILTGINAPQVLGSHKQGFPNEKLRQIIRQHSIFLQLRNLQINPVAFANAYTKEYFENYYPRWKSATTVAVEAAEMSFRMIPDLLGKFAVFHDFTNKSLVERGYQVPLYSPKEAGKILAKIVSQNRFTLYEHFLTDKIGHEQDFEKARLHLPQLEDFLKTVLSEVNLEKTLVILTSDHGNIEDLSVRNHTTNKVPTVIWGKHRHEVAKEIKDLSNITPTIVKFLQT